MLKKLWMTGLALALSAGIAMAQAETAAKPEEPKAEAPKAIEATVTGKVMCISCEASHEAGAKPTAALTAIKVSDAKDAAGNEVPDMKGKIVYVVPTEAAAKLAMGGELSGKNVKATGKVMPEVLAMNVETAEEAAANEWDDWDQQGVGSMSGQPVL